MWIKGKRHTKESKLKMSLHHNKKSNLSGSLSNNWKGGRFCQDCGHEIGSYRAVRCKPCSGLVRRGSNHHNWKGGSTKERVLAFRRLEYKNWRKAVLARDNNTCIKCGSIESLQVDHIKPWALYPKLRYVIDNGRTLCLDCHRQTDTWGFNLANQINYHNVRFEA